MFGIGAAELGVIALLMFGGAGAMPTAGVPLPPDAGLHAAAPPECLLYVASAGIAAPDPKSGNQVEQLLAEEEIQAFLGEIVRLADEGLRRLPADNEEQRTFGRTLPVVVRTLLTRPTMLYVAGVDLPPKPPAGNAALVVNAGEQADALIAALEELEKQYLSQIPPNMSVEKSEAAGAQLRRLPTPPGAPALVWGVQGSYVFLAVGEDEAATLAERLVSKAEAPAWLSDLRRQADVPRSSLSVYLNLAGVLKTVDPLVEQFAATTPFDVRKVLDVLGVGGLRHLAIVSGLDETDAVSKLIVGHDGEGLGLIRLVQGAPLAADDLRRIPKSVDFASVGRFDAASTFQTILKIAEQIEPRTAEQAAAALAQAEDRLGFDVRRDLLEGLGDKLAVYNSPGEGGMLLTGLCATIAVRDRGRIERVIERLQRLGEAALSRERPEVAVRKSTVGDRTVWYVQSIATPLPFAPAWCLTDDELIVGFTPQMVRAHLTRPADAGSLADLEPVAAALKTGDVTGISYSDPKLTYEVLYSYLNLAAAMGAAALEKETGIRADLAKLPSYAVISRHMRPTIGLSRSAKNAYILEGHATGPAVSPASISAVGFAAALLLPAVQSAREVGRQNTSRHNLKNLGLALFMQATAKDDGKLPARAIVDKDGKPLLSWRVAILPQLDRQALYDQFRLDEPWDGEHNRRLIPLMPAIFAHPSLPHLQAQGKTVYQIPTGTGALYEGPEGPTWAERFRLPAGAEGTALIVEAAEPEAVEWTKPSDVELDPDNPAEQLLRFPPQRGPNVLFVGQNVSQIDLDSLTIDQLRRMFFPNFTKK